MNFYVLSQKEEQGCPAGIQWYYANIYQKLDDDDDETLLNWWLEG